MMSLLWYYRPEHTQGGRNPSMHQVSPDPGQGIPGCLCSCRKRGLPQASPCIPGWPQAEYSGALLAVMQLLADVLSDGVL